MQKFMNVEEIFCLFVAIFCTVLDTVSDTLSTSLFRLQSHFHFAIISPVVLFVPLDSLLLHIHFYVHIK